MSYLKRKRKLFFITSYHFLKKKKMRFEKLLYERMVNSKMLKRARTLDRPRKFHYENYTGHAKVQAHKLFGTGITGAIFRTVEPIVAWVFYKWPRDIFLQRGIYIYFFYTSLFFQNALNIYPFLLAFLL